MFYTGLHIAYAVLLCAALWLNRACWRMLLLTAALGAELLWLEIPWEWPTWIWYTKWFAVEMCMVVLALGLQVSASRPVALFAALLGVGHLLGAYFGPSAGIGFYRIVQPLLETCQLVLCLALSSTTTEFIKRQASQAFNLRGIKWK